VIFAYPSKYGSLNTELEEFFMVLANLLAASNDEEGSKNTVYVTFVKSGSLPAFMSRITTEESETFAEAAT